jgi:hypothetical protein
MPSRSRKFGTGRSALSKSDRFHLVLLLHAHQPVGNFEEVFERAYRQCYLAFLDPLERHPRVRVGLHLTGPLWEWIGERHPEYFERLRPFVERSQVELVGGGFYEPILVSIPPADRREQIGRLDEFLKTRFGARPEGAWLAERVWEPHVVEALASSGVGYTLVDDNHFLLSGFEPEELFGYYRVEDLADSVDVFPGLEILRYFIPFRTVEETIDFLRHAAERHPGGMAMMGDDLEKFGIWPGTCEHCYAGGWLEHFFTALEANAEWLAVTPPGEYRREHEALGRAVLPTAAYSEMMEWSLATPARLRSEALCREFGARPDVVRFLRRGLWRNFLVKYPEADLLSRKMQYVSRRLAEAEAAPARGERDRLAEARGHLLRSQCNDAYWHGIFGGLYSPHLRDALWRELVAAERLLDHGRLGPRSASTGIGSPGHNELYFTSDRYAALIDPADGATVESLDFRPGGITLMNSIARRPEAYHAKLTLATAPASGGVVSIHEQVRVKEPGLERMLRYDRWRRQSFRLLLFSEEREAADYAALALGEAAEPASGRFQVARIGRSGVELRAEPSVAALAGSPGARLACEKGFQFQRAPGGFSLRGTVQLSLLDAPRLACRAGLELVLNLLAPESDDRYFSFGAERRPLRWEGVVAGPQVKLVDEWQKVVVTITAAGASELWIAPIETVSESEDGFERVYQGSQILATWPLRLGMEGSWNARVDLRVTSL